MKKNSHSKTKKKYIFDSTTKQNELDKMENELAQKLHLLCDENGKEIDPQQSAPILHKLGRIYLERSEMHDGDDDHMTMISLIRSACLFNAAIARKPENLQVIEDDLKTLCRHVLTTAGACNANANLIAQSNKVKNEIETMRNTVQQKLHEIELNQNKKRKKIKKEKIKVLDIKNLQNDISTKYTDIMAKLLQYCQTVMGDPPCKFALVGMGSLARKEITPYSDFEHIIVLEQNSEQRSDYKDILNYFRWLSVIFQIVLINLQETVVASVDIPSLKWFYDGITTRGICFDGMMPHACKFPLGRTQPTENKQWTTELIKSVDDMLKYLTIAEDLKNGYHLKDILTKVSYVGGDKIVFDDFQTKVYAKMKQENRDEKKQNIKNILVKDLDNFATRSNLLHWSSTTFNLKKDFYRSSTLFISALGQLNNVEASSCFDISEALEKMGIITNRAKHYQMYAVALACELRLKWYMQQNRQDDVIQSTSEDEDSVQILLNIMKASNVIRYFQITYALQCYIAEQFGLKKIHFYTDPKLLNCKLYYRFKQLQNFYKFIQNYSNRTVGKKIRFYSVEEIMNQLEEESKESYELKKAKLEINELIYNHGLWFKEQGSFDEAKDLFEIYLDLTEKAKSRTPSSKNPEIEKVLFQLRCCLMGMHNLDEALTYLKRLLNIYDKTSFDSTVDLNVARTLNNIGTCLMDMHKPDEAFIKLQRSLKIFEQTSLDPTKDVNVARTLNDIGICLKKMLKPDKAFAYLQRSLKIYEQLSPTVDVNVARTLNNISNCLMDMQKSAEAFIYLQRSLKIYEQVLPDPNKDVNVAGILNNIGGCLRRMHKPDKAFTYLQRSQKIYEQASLDPTADVNVAGTLLINGNCLMDTHKLQEAIVYLKRSLKNYERASLDPSVDVNVATSLNSIGVCLIKMYKPDKAFTYLHRSLKIYEQASLDLTKDVNVAATLNSIGNCLMNMHKPCEASTHLHRSLKIYEQASLDHTKDINVAQALNNIGICLMDMHKPDEAFTYLKRSLKIDELASLDPTKDVNVAGTLSNIGLCLIHMHKPDEAFTFLQRSLKIDEQASVDPTVDLNVAGTLNIIGICLMDMHKPDEAFTYVQRSLKIYELASLDPTKDVNLAGTLSNIGLCLIHMHKPDE